jgi:uncharacterized alpha-E superfamily protein
MKRVESVFEGVQSHCGFEVITEVAEPNRRAILSLLVSSQQSPREIKGHHVDALERHLDRVDQSTRTKRKTRRRR